MFRFFKKDKCKDVVSLLYFYIGKYDSRGVQKTQVVSDLRKLVDYIEYTRR